MVSEIAAICVLLIPYFLEGVVVFPLFLFLLDLLFLKKKNIVYTNIISFLQIYEKYAT